MMPRSTGNATTRVPRLRSSDRRPIWMAILRSIIEKRPAGGASESPDIVAAAPPASIEKAPVPKALGREGRAGEQGAKRGDWHAVLLQHGVVELAIGHLAGAHHFAIERVDLETADQIGGLIERIV